MILLFTKLVDSLATAVLIDMPNVACITTQYVSVPCTSQRYLLGFANPRCYHPRCTGAYLCRTQALSRLTAVLLEGKEIRPTSISKFSVVFRAGTAHVFLQQYLIPTVTEVGVVLRLN